MMLKSYGCVLIAQVLAVAAGLHAQAAPLTPLHVQGRRIVTGDGKPILLRGVNAASLEWSSDGEGHILRTVEVAIQDWKSNVVRIPLSQDRWFGKGPEQKDGGESYRSLVGQVVEKGSSLGAYVILDLHWSNTGVWGERIGQHSMPDKNSVAFWKDVARTYRNHPAVIFDLYNEPFGVTWEVWKNGGTVTERGPRGGQPVTYVAVGMQALLTTVRNQGARNLVIVGGIDWAYDLSGFIGDYALADPDGNGIVYACHTYPHKGDTVEQWLAKAKAATAKVPVIFSEFGSEAGPKPDATGRRTGFDNPDWLQPTLAALHENRWHWTAWDLHPSAGPRLISDWDYTPTPYFGVPVKRLLATPLKP